MTTGQQRRVARETARISLRQLARAMQVSPQYLLDLERGNRPWKERATALHDEALARLIAEQKPNASLPQ